MRSTRIVSALVALILAASMPLLAGAPAEAKAKPRREISAHGVNGPNGTLFLKGQIEGNYSKRNVILERKARPSSNFVKFKTFKSRDNSSYRTQVPGLAAGSNKTCFRVKVPASNRYRTSRSPARCVT